VRGALAWTISMVCLFAVAFGTGCARRPAWELPPPASVDKPIVAEDRLTRADLDNGLRVLVLEDHRLPRVVLSLTARRGEAMVALEEAGLAGFTAELMRRGAGERDSLALSEAVDELGASLAVSASWDTTRVTIRGLSRDLDMLLEILADVVLRPRFDAEEARKTRDETLAHLERAKDKPATLANWYAARALFEGHRYGIPLAGNSATVAELRVADARRYHAEVFQPNNCVFAASGDVDATVMLERTREIFGQLARGELPVAGEPTPYETPAATKVLIVDQPDLVQARIFVGHEGIARTDSERIPASITNSVLGGSGFSSRLTSSVRADAGLTYGVYSGFSLRREISLFAISTFTRVAEVRTVLDLLLGELARMRSEPPEEAELSAAKTLATGSFALGLETSDAVIGSLVDLDVYGLPEDSLDTYRARVRAVTPADAAREATRLFHPDRVAIVLVGPAEQLRPQVEDLGPVEVVTP